MFKVLQRTLAVALLLGAIAVPVSAQAAEGGSPSASMYRASTVQYQLWVREIDTMERWWLWHTYSNYDDADWIAHFFQQYGYDTYIVPVSIYDTKSQLIYPWD